MAFNSEEITKMPDSEDNPFTVKDGKTVLKFDGILIRADDEPGYIVAELMYKGKPMYSLGSSRTDFVNGDTLMISGVSGVIEVSLDPAA